jgi:hypothetical protein
MQRMTPFAYFQSPGFIADPCKDIENAIRNAPSNIQTSSEMAKRWNDAPWPFLPPRLWFYLRHPPPPQLSLRHRRRENSSCFHAHRSPKCARHGHSDTLSPSYSSATCCPGAKICQLVRHPVQLTPALVLPAAWLVVMRHTLYSCVSKLSHRDEAEAAVCHSLSAYIST